MNIIQFLNRVDEITAVCDRQQLVSFVHETARLLEEEKREEFLARLSNVLSETSGAAAEDGADACNGGPLGHTAADGGPLGHTADDDALAEEYCRISEALEQIEDEELSLHEDYNEEYDDWYNPSADEFIYTDPDGIQAIVDDACVFVHQCVDRCSYDDGADIGKRLFSLRIPVSGDYGSDDFTLSDLREIHRLDANLKSVALDALYCIYHACRSDERPQQMYDLISESLVRDLGIGDLMQRGSAEPEGFDDFLTLWIAFLQERCDPLSDRLFLEAVELKDDTALSIELARVAARTHPKLYLHVLAPKQYQVPGEKQARHPQVTAQTQVAAQEQVAAQTQVTAQNLLNLGMEALGLTDPASPIRSEIALLTADYAVEAMDMDKAETCYLECFRSSPLAIHYLRAVLNIRDTTFAKEKLDEMWRQAQLPMGNEAYAVEFLRGNFTKVLTEKNAMGMQDALGWSWTFMKEGFALFALYLYEGTAMQKGMKAMAEAAADALGFTMDKYARGLGLGHDLGLGLDAGAGSGADSRLDSGLEKSDRVSANEFYPYFVKWKSLTPMSEDDAHAVIRRMEEMVKLRVTGIMSANKRNYYGECASFIAALGEVEESRGNMGRKQAIMSYYMEQYKRRWAFRDELRKYGWRG